MSQFIFVSMYIIILVYLFSFVTLCILFYSEKEYKSLCGRFPWTKEEDLKMVQRLKEGSCRIEWAMVKVVFLEVLFHLVINTLVDLSYDWD